MNLNKQNTLQIITIFLALLVVAISFYLYEADDFQKDYSGLENKEVVFEIVEDEKSYECSVINNNVVLRDDVPCWFAKGLGDNRTGTVDLSDDIVLIKGYAETEGDIRQYYLFDKSNNRSIYIGQYPLRENSARFRSILIEEPGKEFVAYWDAGAPECFSGEVTTQDITGLFDFHSREEVLDFRQPIILDCPDREDVLSNEAAPLLPTPHIHTELLSMSSNLNILYIGIMNENSPLRVVKFNTVTNEITEDLNNAWQSSDIRI